MSKPRFQVREEGVYRVWKWILDSGLLQTSLIGPYPTLRAAWDAEQHTRSHVPNVSSKMVFGR